MDAALNFYTKGFGMKVLDRFDVPSRRVSGAYIGYGDFGSGGLLELTHKWDDAGITVGSFHVAIGVPDMDAFIEALVTAGASVDMEPRVLVPGEPRVAFIRDPDG